MADRDYSAIAKTYAKDVIAGRIGACKWVKFACRRFLQDVKDGKKKGWTFDETEVWSVCNFIEQLPHVEGRWETPTITLEPWQIFILANVFGFRYPDGRRRFDTAYIEVARKNAKSTLTSGVSLYCLTMEGEVGPQVKIAATTNSQARIVFDVAKKMAEKTPALIDACELEPLANAVVSHLNGGSMQPINAKASTQDGLNPHLSVIDELHAHKSRALFDVLKSARGARKNPLSWYITTAGYNTQGVAYEQRQLVEKILEGVLPGDHYFGMVFTLDEGDDPFDESVWIKANPNLGISVQLHEFRNYALEAKNSIASLAEFKTKRLNMWLNAVGAWLSVEHWDKCADPTLSLEDFEGQDCWIGVDMSDKDDITAVVLMFERDGMPVIFERFYLPRLQVEVKAQTVGAHYAVWAAEGHLTLTEGDWISRDTIKADLRGDLERFNVLSVVFDQHSGAQAIAEELQDECEKVVIMPKTAKNFTAPATEFEARIKNNKLRHRGSPVMRWMVSNVVVERRVDKSLLPKKPSAMSPLKIDGIDATLQAEAGRSIIAPQGSGKRSIYESRDMVVV